MSRSKGPTAWGNREGGIILLSWRGKRWVWKTKSQIRILGLDIYVFVGFDEKRAQLAWSRGSGPAVLVTETRGLSAPGCCGRVSAVCACRELWWDRSGRPLFRYDTYLSRPKSHKHGQRLGIMRNSEIYG